MGRREGEGKGGRREGKDMKKKSDSVQEVARVIKVQSNAGGRRREEEEENQKEEQEQEEGTRGEREGRRVGRRQLLDSPTR